MMYVNATNWFTVWRARTVRTAWEVRAFKAPGALLKARNFELARRPIPGGARLSER